MLDKKVGKLYLKERHYKFESKIEAEFNIAQSVNVAAVSILKKKID